MRVYYQKEHQRITNNTDSGQWLIVTDATGDRWVKCEELRFGGGEDVTGHQWSLNRYENDLLTAGCHRIAYNEMERIAKQLGWV